MAEDASGDTLGRLTRRVNTTAVLGGTALRALG